MHMDVEAEAMEVMVVQAQVVVMIQARVLVLVDQVEYMVVERGMEAVVAIILTQGRTSLRSSIEVAPGFQYFSISHHRLARHCALLQVGTI